jgi:hypothetical protein
MEQEHSSFADNTIGGIHTPGGAAILGIEDGTFTIVADGTLKGHGIVWDNSSRLYCSTAVAGASTTGDWTLIKLHPDKQWGGQDVTWTGSHEFDGSVDISGPLTLDGAIDCSVIIVDGSVDISGALDCSVLGVDGSADFSDAGFGGDVTVSGLLKVDGTATEFGGTAGIGLFYDPTTPTGASDATETSVIVGNGLTFKFGRTAYVGNDTDISFAVPFPTACFQVICGNNDNADSVGTATAVNNVAVGGFEAHNNTAGLDGYRWLAIGY